MDEERRGKKKAQYETAKFVESRHSQCLQGRIIE